MKCKKVKFADGGDTPSLIYGIIEYEDNVEITVRTGSGKKYRIRKEHIFSIVDTNKEFIQK
jgi:hypothetical protein